MRIIFSAVLYFGALFCCALCEGLPDEESTESNLLKNDTVPTPAPECYEPRDVSVCRAAIPMWYYDPDFGICKEFIWGGCPGNANLFSNRESCVRKCQPATCLQPAVTGPCRANIRMWYYDRQFRVCKQFSYGGCEGNENKFPTEAQCQTACAGANNICKLGGDFKTVGNKAATSNYRDSEWFSFGCGRRCREKCTEEMHPWGTCKAYSVLKKWYKCTCYLYDRYLSEMDLVQSSKGVTRNRQCASDSEL